MVRILSTRNPDHVPPHDWAEQALRETAQLTPVTVPQIWAAVTRVIKAGPVVWWQVARAICETRPRRVKPLLRQVALAGLGSYMARVLESNDIEHVHVHSCGDAANVALYASQINRSLLYSLTLHGPIEDYGGNQKVKWHGASFSCVITRRLQNQVEDVLGPDVAHNTILAPMGVDAESFQRQGPYKGPSRRRVRLFSCGRLHPCKGHDVLIRTVELLVRRGLAVELRIAGRADEATPGHVEELEALIRRGGLEETIKMLGAIGEHEVKNELEAAEIFTLASKHEPLGVAYMEAMAMSMPVIGTRAGGVSELITDGVEGRLVPPGDPDALAEAVEELADSPEKCAAMGVAGRETVQAKFGIERRVERLLSGLHRYVGMNHSHPEMKGEPAVAVKEPEIA
jgi:glycosyltransferase involved in cell wall biosynthesis